MNFAGRGAVNYNPNNDREVAQGPDDAISSLSWSPTANLLVASSWDSKVRCWQVNQDGSTVLKGQIAHQAPVLDACWDANGARVFSGGCDHKAMCWDVATGNTFQVAQHDAPIKIVKWVNNPASPMLCTGSWDKSLRYWDLRSPSPIAKLDLPERVYCADFHQDVAVVGLANRHLQVYNLQNPGQVFKTIQSPLKYQSRSVSIFPDKTGFVLGSIEGRVAVHHINDAEAAKNFAFKCHRDQSNNVYSINALCFHMQEATFATCGSDGAFHFWDKENRSRVKQFNTCPLPIVAASFNRDGLIFAYAQSYDWSRGVENYQPQQQRNVILLHGVQVDEVRKKKKNGKK